jgi:hypothetical protein
LVLETEAYCDMRRSKSGRDCGDFEENGRMKVKDDRN